MSNAKVLSTKFIGFVSNASRTVQVGYVDKTDIWTRSFLDTDIQKKFEQAAQDNIDTLRADTAMIALQYVVSIPVFEPPMRFSVCVVMVSNSRVPQGNPACESIG